ncbi:hypothetical protein LIA77_04037 [Sarocladium implicatum]|nr:hypothetical protein LIA77_04037 [Sarocladium implicatum]
MIMPAARACFPHWRSVDLCQQLLCHHEDVETLASVVFSRTVLVEMEAVPTSRWCNPAMVQLGPASFRRVPHKVRPLVLWSTFGASSWVRLTALKPSGPLTGICR